MNNYLKSEIVILLLGIFLHGSVEGLFAQNKEAAGGAGLKGLILKKFDANRDGSLTAYEKANAVAFLKDLDANGDGQISMAERNKAVKELSAMTDPSAKVSSGKMTLENRNVPKRLAKWVEFSKKLPHGAGPRIFTSKSMPGEPGFSIKGEKEIDPAMIKGDLNVPSQISNADLEAKLAKRKSDRKHKVAVSRVQPEKVPASLVKAAKKERGYYDNTIILAQDGEHTVVPKGAVLSVPPGMEELVVKEPVGKLVRWPEFLKKYPRKITTREVSWETVKGRDPISEKEQKAFAIGRKVVVAVFKKSPVTVLEAPPEGDVASGAVVSDKIKRK